jgi:hypothetical protein
MGGTTSFNCTLVRDGIQSPAITARELISINAVGLDLDKHGADQTFLNRFFWPKFAKQTIIHTKRKDITYDCMRAYPVAEQETDLDKVVRHIGAGYDTSEAMKVLSKMDYPERKIIEECEK